MDIPRLAAGPVLLRGPVDADVDPCHRACQDPDSQRWLGALPSPYTRADAEFYLRRLVPEGWLGGTTWNFVVADAATDALVGSLGFHAIRVDEAITEVGYWVAPWARGRGAATAALHRACTWATAEQGMQRIEWYAAVGNIASRRVAEKVGFRYEGTMRSRFVRRHDGARSDAWVGALLASDIAPEPSPADREPDTLA